MVRDRGGNQINCCFLPPCLMHMRVFPCAFLLHPPAKVHLRRCDRSADDAAAAVELLLELLLPYEMAVGSVCDCVSSAF